MHRESYREDTRKTVEYTPEELEKVVAFHVCRVYRVSI